jgi:hypothetical protein
MQEKILHRKYYVQDYGGQQSTETRKSTISNVMSVKG